MIKVIIPKEVLETIFEYIDARIDEKIESAFGRNSFSESIRCHELKNEIMNYFGENEE